VNLWLHEPGQEHASESNGQPGGVDPQVLWEES
jgi:hypothetical protein